MGLGMCDFKNVHIMKWKLNKTFMGNVKGQMYVDVASEGSNKFYIFKLLDGEGLSGLVYTVEPLLETPPFRGHKIWYRNNVHKLYLY